MVETIVTKQWVEDIAKSKDSLETATKLITYHDSLKVIFALIRYTNEYCDKLRQEDLKLYKQNIIPLQVIVSDVEKRLKKRWLSAKKKHQLYITLFEAQKQISSEGEKFRNSNKRNMTIFSSGAAVGLSIASIALVVFRKFFSI